MAIAVGVGVTFYDASYLAVARLNKATVVTADARFSERISADFPVRVLGEKDPDSQPITGARDAGAAHPSLAGDEDP